MLDVLARVAAERDEAAAEEEAPEDANGAAQDVGDEASRRAGLGENSGVAAQTSATHRLGTERDQLDVCVEKSGCQLGLGLQLWLWRRLHLLLVVWRLLRLLSRFGHELGAVDRLHLKARVRLVA